MQFLLSKSDCSGDDPTKQNPLVTTLQLWRNDTMFYSYNPCLRAGLVSTMLSLGHNATLSKLQFERHTAHSLIPIPFSLLFTLIRLL